MNIGWIFLICALLILVLMAFRPWRKRDQPESGGASKLDELDTHLVRTDEVLDYVRAGQMVDAIQVYRTDTGASLADARAAVERMELTARPQGQQVT